MVLCFTSTMFFPHCAAFSPRPLRHRPLRALLLGLFAALLLQGCAAKVDRGPVRDLLALPQDLTAYLDPDTANTPLFNEQQLASISKDYLSKFFFPWGRTTSFHSREDLFWGFTRYQNRTTWGEHYRARGPWWVAELALNADGGDYPNTNRPAIATQATAMRVLPTHEPIFADPTQPGEGFPFDYNQNSLVSPGTPLFVVQASADGAWLLCETSFAGGWIASRDVAFVDQGFMDEYRSGPFAALIAEGVPLFTNGLFRIKSRIGMLLPLRKVGLGSGTVLLPLRELDGTARLEQATVAGSTFARFPLTPTPATIAVLGNRMMGQPYGWGGLYELRDCSATLMDLFAPFGMALPRNSRSQAATGTVTDVSTLAPQEKKRALMSMPPFSTLVGKRGHIMLYVGDFHGEPVIYHTVWGVRTTTTGPLPGRHIIGQTVVTTLEPGKELRHLGKKAMLVQTISAFADLRGLATN